MDKEGREVGLEEGGDEGEEKDENEEEGVGWEGLDGWVMKGGFEKEVGDEFE